MNNFTKSVSCLLITLIAIFGLYWQSTNFGFVLDDRIVIEENSFVKEGTKGIKDILSNDSMTGFLGKQPDLLAGGRYRPLSLVVFALGYDIFGLNAKWFHILNLLFYALSVFLFYLTISKLFKNSIHKNVFPVVCFSVLLFAVHPVHTEVVANIKGLDEILAFLFAMPALLFMMLHYDKKKPVYIFLAGLCFLLSLLSKESTLPLLAVFPVSLFFYRGSTFKKAAIYFGYLLVPVVVYLFIRYEAMGFLLNNKVNTTGIMNDPYFEAGISKKFGTILFTLLLYLKLLFFPHPLTHDYYPFHIKHHEIYHPLALLGLFVLAGLVYIAAKGFRSRNIPAFIILWFLATLSIVSNALVNVGTFMNERFLFVPSAAFSMLVIYSFIQFEKKNLAFKVLLVFWLLTGIGFVIKSYLRIPAWENEKTLNAAAVKVSKNSARANCFYAVSLYDDIRAEENTEIKLQKTEVAKKHIDRSLEIYPEYADALRMKAGLAAEEYKVKKNVKTLLAVFKEILAVRHIAYVDEYTDWLERRTDKKTMSDYYFEVGYNIFAVKEKNLNLATRYLEKGYQSNKDHMGIIFGNCIVNYFTKKYQKCIDFGDTYIQRFGDNAEIYFYTGNAMLKSGQQQSGLQYLNKAYQLNPELKNKKAD